MVCGAPDASTVKLAPLVTVVVVVFVGHVVAEPDGEHPGPCHCAVFWIVPGAAVASTVTAKPRSTLAPAGTPAEIVHVI
jgi:hypothetical protein